MRLQASLENLSPVLESLYAKIASHPLPLVFLLQGDLASGKTTLVQRFCASLNAPHATSPTFSLLHTYQAPKFGIYHYDFYLKSLPELVALGILEHLELEGVHFIEWGADLKEMLIQAGFKVCVVNLTRLDQGCLYEIVDG
ncbi:ATPase YjeE, predicted to have essential role in cell wall biosynthesis [Helicobacter bizzozeronii CCUG 35545]|nr:ATPase YjeE, predicted to have essential role in cell wall biosynthesis [Helicobacter bizzozeronii CCUG 35545]